MSFSEDALKAKLSAINETQESIVSVAQYVIFYRRYAERIAQLWMQRLKELPAPKRLNLIYVANEVVQQQKARKREEFLLAFTPIIAEATAVTAKGANNDVLQKLRRVVEVWRQRLIFDQTTQDSIEAKLDEVDKSSSRAPTKKPMLGGSLFSDSTSSTPPELQLIAQLQQAVTKSSLVIKPLTSKSDAEYIALNDTFKPTPSPPVHAKDLNSLIKTLANAEDAVAESLRARRALIEGLEKLLETNKTDLAAEETRHVELAARKEAMTSRRREVEDQILQSLSSTDNGKTVDDHDDADEIRPEVEHFTPPPTESTTPPGSPHHSGHLDGAAEEEGSEDRPEFEALTPPPVTGPPTPPALSPPAAYSNGGSVLGNSSITSTNTSGDPRRRLTTTKSALVEAHPRPDSNSPVNGTNANSGVKRRKLSAKDGEYFEEGADAMEGLDADVVGMLG